MRWRGILPIVHLAIDVALVGALFHHYRDELRNEKCSSSGVPDPFVAYAQEAASSGAAVGFDMKNIDAPFPDMMKLLILGSLPAAIIPAFVLPGAPYASKTRWLN